MTMKKTLKILFVEDEVLVAMETMSVLEGLGYETVHEANSVSDALALTQSNTYDLAVMDVNLHGKSSLRIAKDLLRNGTKLIFTTGYNYDTDLFGGLDAQIVLKSYGETQLKNAISEACPS